MRVVVFLKNVWINFVRNRCIDVQNMDDGQEYRDMRNAMNVIGITADEQRDIFTLLASILWIGNCGIVERNGNAAIGDMQVVDFIASLVSDDKFSFLCLNFFDCWIVFA